MFSRSVGATRTEALAATSAVIDNAAYALGTERLTQAQGASDPPQSKSRID